MPKTVLCEPAEPACHNSDRQNQSALSTRQVFPQYLLGGISPSGSIPVLSTSHWSSETDLGASIQKAGRPCPRQSCNNHRAKRKPHSTSSAGSGHHDNNHALIKGIMDNTQRGKMWQAYITKTVFAQKYYTHKGYTGTLPHKNCPSRPW